MRTCRPRPCCSRCSRERSPLDVFPDFVPSQVDIQTEAPGFAPQQVEELVTKQVENAVNGAAGLATLRSESIPGLSVVNITFTDGIDVHIARQGISERLSELGSSLPAGVGTPKLSPLVSSTMDLLKIGLLSDKLDAYELRDTADWIIEPRLLAVAGVAHVIYLFLRDFRAALIAFTAIPLSLLASVAVLDHRGLTLNTMTLGGFAVALGVLVDDAIFSPCSCPNCLPPACRAISSVRWRWHSSSRCWHRCWWQ